MSIHKTSDARTPRLTQLTAFKLARVSFLLLGVITSLTLAACKNPLVQDASTLSSKDQPVGSTSYRPMSLTNSTIVATGPVTSDGVSASVVLVTLKDADGVAITGVTPTFSATDTQMLNIYGACAVTNNAGQSTCTLKSTYGETKLITLRSPAVLAGNSVEFQDALSGITNSSISATSSITADGVSLSAISLTLKDGSNNPFAETPILAVSGTGNTLNCATTNRGTGVTLCTLKSTKAETKTITIVSPSGIGGLSTSSTFVAGAVSTATSTVSTTSGHTADNTDTATVTVTLKDIYSNPISTTPTLTVTGTGNTFSCGASIAATGVATCTVSTTKAEIKSIAVATPAALSSLTSVSSTFVAGAASSVATTLSAVAGSPVADTIETATITVTLLDVYSNVIGGITPTLSITGSANTSSCTSSNATTGVSTCTLTSTAAEVKTISISSPTGLTSLTDTKTFVAGAATANSTISAAGTPNANGTDLATATVTLKDAYSNLVSGITPTLAATGSGNTVNACSSSSASGISTCTLTSTIAEAKAITLLTPATATATSSATANFTPVVTSITPRAGLSTGGTTITLTGQGFKNGNTVKINGVACSSSGYTNATTMTCVTPVLAGVNGTYDLTVTTSDGNIGTLSKSFVYVGAPMVWLKADALTGLNSGDPVASWTDSSASANHAIQANAAKKPLWISNALNGQPVIRMDGTDDELDFTSSMTTIRTVFAVFKHATGVQEYALILGSTATYYDFNGGMDSSLFSTPYASSYLLNGSTYMNGLSMNPINILKPKNYSLLSMVTTGNMRANTIGAQWTLAGRYWNGDFAEFIIYNTALSTADRQAVESYLQAKYALPSAANSTFTVAGTPLSNNSDLATVTVTQLKDSQGNALPISSPTVAVTGTNNTVSAATTDGSGGWTFTVKSSSAEGKRISLNNTYFGNANFVPVSGMISTMSSMQLWFKADAISGLANGASVSSWPDSSGKGHDTFQGNSAIQPTLTSSDALANNQPTVTFGAGSTCLTGSTGNALTGLTTPSIFVVAKPTNTLKGGSQELISFSTLGSGDQPWNTSGMSVSMGANRSWFNTNNAGTYRYAGYGGTVGETGGYYWSMPNNAFYILTALASGGTGVIYAGGGNTETGEGAWIASVSPSAFNLGNMAPSCGSVLGNNVAFEGNIAEVIMYNTRLSNTDRKAVECYLKAKYNSTLFYTSCP